MPDDRSKAPSRVSLEDLLCLKRSERPAADFWTEFERTLRQKQLAALVERRSWWHNVLAVYSRFGRFSLPLGAAAVAAVTFLSFRSQFRTENDLNLAAGGIPPPQQATVASGPSTSKVSLGEPAPALSPAQSRPAEDLGSANSGKGTTLAAVTTVGPARQSVAPISWLDDSLDGPASRADLATVARSIAVNLVAASSNEPSLVETMGRPLGFEERAMPVSHLQHAAEFLPTAAAVTEPRRARLLAALGSAGVYAPEPTAPEHAKRSVLRYLAEDGWDRSMSRLEAEGDKLSIKF